ncbi:MAG: hypothetical protein ACE5GJ_04000, partial [Gemmatimonadota bacterium]
MRGGPVDLEAVRPGRGSARPVCRRSGQVLRPGMGWGGPRGRLFAMTLTGMLGVTGCTMVGTGAPPTA